ncbi:proteasome assembly chaperone family protein [Cellulosimicrobium marinum]|uniref:proteasome assembly chaperone family protein n=1 Tax=Cellulosimicrobium marinum TaxID=1638992 RepID=UPI001E64E6B4|nr:PAC2 family protein [Cellulosimicrobium marinum]MCB7137767.1 PAC2 family protein [Cellulosimicrobium marinum]
MLDPSQLYDLDQDAVARLWPSPPEPGAGPVLVHAVAGFVDAGSAGELAVEHLLELGEVTRVATFDVDQLLDYRSKRATMTFSSDHWSDYDEPYLVVDHVRDAAGTGFLLLHGAEPDVQWERVVAALRDLVDLLGVSLTVGVHGIPMGVPHTRPTSVTAHGTRPELLGEHTSWFGTVKVPASLAALLELRLGRAGHDAVGYTVHVPHYLAQSSYAPAAVAALEHVQRLTGLELRTDGLEEAAQEATAEVERQVRDSEEVASVVRALEEQYDAFARAVGRTSLLAESAPIPTADELGAEFERFLAQQSGD